jgi:hypothetical protein
MVFILGVVFFTFRVALITPWIDSTLADSMEVEVGISYQIVPGKM